MPRHNPESTPPERRRARKGSVVGRFGGYHTEESLSHLEALKAEWRLSEVETIREALRRCATKEE